MIDADEFAERSDARMVSTRAQSISGERVEHRISLLQPRGRRTEASRSISAFHSGAFGGPAPFVLRVSLSYGSRGNKII